MSRIAAGQDCVSDLTLDRLRAGELSEGSARALEHHLEQCDACRRRSAELTAMDAEYLERYPALPSRVLKRESSGGRSRGKMALAVAASLAALAAAVALRSTGPNAAGPGTEERVKGATHLGFHVKRGPAIFEGSEGTVVYRGDRLRFAVTSAKPTYVAILSRDGAGVTTEYYPGDGRARAFGVGRGQLVDSSVELDAVLGTELVTGVFCPAPFDVAPLLRALREEGKVSAPPNCEIDAIHIEKRSSP